MNPSPLVATATRIRVPHPAILWMSLMLMSTLSQSLAFNRPVFVVRNHLRPARSGFAAFPPTHRLPMGARTRTPNHRVAAPSGRSVTLLFESSRKSDGNEEGFVYDIYGKFNKTRSGSRHKRTRKRQIVKRAAENMFNSIKDRAVDKIFREVDEGGDSHSDSDGVLSKTELDEIARRLSKQDEEQLQYFLKGLRDENGDDLINFEKLDTDGGGVLTPNELSKSFGVTVNRDDFSLLHSDSDGLINKNEFDKASSSSKYSDETEEDNVTMAPTLPTLPTLPSLGSLQPLERQEMRLGGFDPYILVSVLTAQSSFEVINDYQYNWDELILKTSLAEITSEDWYVVTLMVTAGIATLVGLYAAVMFSLTVLYGRTALGMERDEEYFTFLDQTGLQRFRGFKAFTASLFLLCVLVAMQLFRKTPMFLWLPLGMASVGLLYFGKIEYDIVIEAAKPIFLSTESKDDDDNDTGDNNGEMDGDT
eukprot:jgi/Psemu1/23386/gm1.23386_g